MGHCEENVKCTIQECLSGINCQPIVCILVVLICLRIVSGKVMIHIVVWDEVS